MSRRSFRIPVAGLILLFSSIPASRALFSDRTSSVPSSITGAAFNVSVAPVPVAARHSSGIELAATRVTINSGHPVDQTISRRGSDGSTATICNLAASSGADITCADNSLSSRVTYTYRSSATLVRNGVATWQLGPGNWSEAVPIPTIQFAGVGDSATAPKNGTAIVSQPSGTASGDLLLLVVTSSRNIEPTVSAGWTRVAAVGTQGTDSMHLYVGWKIAGATATQTTITPGGGATSTGTVIRYSPWAGNTITPGLAVSAAAVGNIVTPTLLPLSPTSTKSYSTFISVVASDGLRTISLAQPNAYTFRFTRVLNTNSLGVADAVTESAGSAAQMPVWQANPPSTTWLYATIAFS